MIYICLYQKTNTMALKEGEFFRGTLGALVFRVVRGKQRVSVKEEPGTRKQTVATKAAAKRLGMASSLGAEIRKTFEINVEDIYDPTVNERLTGILIKILTGCRDVKTNHFNFQEDSFKKLQNFEFNSNALMQRFITVIPAVSILDGVVEVRFGEIDITKNINFPRESFRCTIMISMSLLRLRDGKVLGTAEVESVDFTLANDTLDAQLFKFRVPGGCLCLLKMTLKFAVAGKTGFKKLGSNKVNPSCIIGALITPGVYEQDSRKRWLEMIKFD